MEKSDAEPSTSDVDTSVVRESAETSEEEHSSVVSRKWKWVWRNICYVAEPIDESTTNEDEDDEERMECQDDDDDNVVMSIIGEKENEVEKMIKRKSEDDDSETDQTAGKKVKHSNPVEIAEKFENL